MSIASVQVNARLLTASSVSTVNGNRPKWPVVLVAHEA